MQNPIHKYQIDKSILGYILFGFALLAVCIYIKDLWQGVMSLIDVLKPVIFGLAFAVILNVLMRFLERRIFDKLAVKFPKFAHAERIVAIICTLLIIAGLASLLFVIVLPQFIASLSLLASRLPTYVEQFIEWADRILRFYNLDTLLLTEFANYTAQLIKSLTEFLTNAVPDILGFTASFAGGLLNVIFGLIFAIYMLAGKEKLTANLNRFMDCFLPDWFNEKARYVVKATDETFSRFLEGQCLDALCLGCLSFIVLSIMDMPYTLVIAVTLAFTNIIPVVGPWLGSIPCAVITFVISPIKALILVITIIILQEVENKLIYPRIVGGRVGLDGIWVLIGVLCGGKLGGLLGILLGVPVVAVLGRLISDKLKKHEGEAVITDEK
ncbi:MAG: AI-2E family transporter [Firmicutes bacterium]|nr:AI-2E family transporter [Bacillota bacterium]MBQ6810129.1 AI-2E family transporter [Bacillota bacterium]